MTPDLGNRFQSFALSKGEEEAGRSINPYTLAYIQNKISAYAHAVVEFEYDPTTPITTSILEHEKLKAKVVVLEELLDELKVPTPDPEVNPQPEN